KCVSMRPRVLCVVAAAAVLALAAPAALADPAGRAATTATATATATASTTASAPTPLVFGVYPGNTFTFGKYAGLSGSNPVATDSDLALDRMVELAAGRPFDVHLYLEWNSGVPAGFDNLVDRLTARGLTVNLAVKYVPPAGHDGDIAGFAAWVGSVVSTHSSVGVFQVTNEANVPGSPDTDG